MHQASKIKTLFGRGLRRVPLVRRMVEPIDNLRWRASLAGEFQPGHYYSPIPDWTTVQPKETQAGISVAGVELNAQKQIELLKQLCSTAAPDHPLTRYYRWPNTFFHRADALVLDRMVGHLRPKRIIEVGSGYSSAVIADAIARYELETQCCLVDPDPSRVQTLFGERLPSGIELKAESVKDVESGMFGALGADDILFVDSSHVAKSGSDVNHIVFDILPRVQSGVVVHFHDLFYPFEYPRDWYERGRAWNEGFILRAFLQFNREFQIILFMDFLRQHHAAELEAMVGRIGADEESSEVKGCCSLWLRRR